jgi:hypothetical protein
MAAIWNRLNVNRMMQTAVMGSSELPALAAFHQ